MSLPRYPSYKGSGVEWLREVPEHWEVKPNKAFLEPRKSVVGSTWADKTLLSLTLAGVIPRDTESGKGKFPADFGTYQDVAESDLVFCLFDIDETPRSVGLAQSAGMITGAYDVFRCKTGTDPRFVFYYYLHIDAFKGLRPFYTGLRKVVRPPTFMAVKIPLPTFAEQTAIAEFLDRETVKIDELVAEQRRLMELLKEKRQAVISHAVTRGLNPAAPLKPSGIEWLGDVPAHWSLVPVAYRYNVQLGKMLDSTKITGEHLRPYLRVFDVQWGDINTDELPEMDFDQDARARFRLVPGDLLVNEGGSYPGRSAIWIGKVEECYYQKALHRMRAHRPKEDSTRFMYYLMSWAANHGVFTAGGNEATIEHLPAEKLRRYRFAFPPVSEQLQIATFLDVELAKFDTLTAEAQRAIDLLQERRTALISAAVTGQIDVRDCNGESKR